MPKSLVELCQILLKAILIYVQYRTLCLEPSVPEELLKNPCFSKGRQHLPKIRQSMKMGLSVFKNHTAAACLLIRCSL